MTTRRTHSRIQIPVITVYCDDPIHADVPTQVVARLGKYPPAGGWRLMSDVYEDQFDDTSTDHRRRFADEAVTVGGRTALQPQMPQVRSTGKAKAVTVPVGRRDCNRSATSWPTRATLPRHFGYSLLLFVVAQAANTKRPGAHSLPADGHSRLGAPCPHRPLRTTVPESGPVTGPPARRPRTARRQTQPGRRTARRIHREDPRVGSGIDR